MHTKINVRCDGRYMSPQYWDGQGSRGCACELQEELWPHWATRGASCLGHELLGWGQSPG